ncbi:NIPSNAP family protein [Streptomyces decoyicus]
MITCCIQYKIDPWKLEDFERYAKAWPPIIERCGGDLTGYYLPKEGSNDFALALINFASLADYEKYRERLAADTQAGENIRQMKKSGCILVESRSFLRKV